VDKKIVDLEVGDKVWVIGEVVYGQDHGFHKGELEDVVFTVAYINTDPPFVKLTAPGYGDPRYYGNGAVYIRPQYFCNLHKAGQPLRLYCTHPCPFPEGVRGRALWEVWARLMQLGDAEIEKVIDYIDMRGDYEWTWNDEPTRAMYERDPIESEER